MPGLGPPKVRLCHVRRPRYLSSLYPSSSHRFSCQFFDNRGHRIHLHGEYGCPRSAALCHFVHPSDPEWESIVRRETRRFSDDHSARRSPASPSRGRDRRRSPSFDRRQRTPPRGSVRARSPVWHRSSSRSPRRDDHPPPHHHDRDARPPRRSSSHERPSLFERLDLDHVPQSSKAPPQLVMSLTNSRDRPSDQEAKSSPIAPVKGTAAAMPSGATTPAVSKPASETASKPSGSMAAPSRRPFSEALPPPPIQNSFQPSDDAITPEQRRAVWERRIA